MVKKFNKTFLGRQLCENIKYADIWGTESVPETSEYFYILMQLSAWEDFIESLKLWENSAET